MSNLARPQSLAAVGQELRFLLSPSDFLLVLASPAVKDTVRVSGIPHTAQRVETKNQSHLSRMGTLASVTLTE